MGILNTISDHYLWISLIFESIDLILLIWGGHLIIGQEFKSFEGISMKKKKNLYEMYQK